MKTILPISSLLLSVSFLMTGHGLMGTLLPLRGLADGFSSTILGVMGALYFVGFGLGTVFAPRLIARVGHIRTFAALAAVICISVSAQGAIIEPVFWSVTRMATGFCLAGLYVAIESWLNANSTNENRGMIFSIYTVINLAVITLGQLLTAVADVADVVLFTIATILFAASVVPVSLTKSSAPIPAEATKLRVRYLLSASPVAIIGALAVGLTNGAFWSLGAIFAERETGSVAQVATFMSLTVFAGAVGQLPFGWLSDRLDRRVVIMIATFGAAMAAFGHVIFARFWEVGIFPCSVVFGAFAFPLYALCAAHLNDKVEDDGYVEAASGLLLIYASGAAIGPLLASPLMDMYQPDMLFIFTSVVHVLLGVFTATRLNVRKSAPDEDKTSFTDTLVVSSTVANIDPSEDEAAQPAAK